MFMLKMEELVNGLIGWIKVNKNEDAYCISFIKFFCNSWLMLEGPAYYYFKQIDKVYLIDVIVRVAIGKHREWIHNCGIDKF